MQPLTLKMLGPLDSGKTSKAIRETVNGAGQSLVKFSLDADTILVIVNCISHTSGSLDIKVRGLIENGSKDLVVFPTISGTTAELQIQKAAISLSNMELVVDYNGQLEYEVWIRGVSGAVGDQTVKIIPGGVDSLRASQTSITTSASILVPPTSFDRAGIIIRNWNPTAGTLFIKENSTNVVSEGYPLAPLEALAMDVDSNVTVYGQADTGTIDVRILEGGS